MSLITYAKLTIDGQGILIPKSELIHLEQRSNIKLLAQETMHPTVGYIDYEQEKWPVYALNGTFSVLKDIPDQRQLAACVTSGDYQLCIACDAATTIQNGSEFILEDLPEMMRTRTSPIQALLYDRENLYFITSAKALKDYLLSEESGN